MPAIMITGQGEFGDSVTEKMVSKAAAVLEDYFECSPGIAKALAEDAKELGAGPEAARDVGPGQRLRAMLVKRWPKTERKPGLHRLSAGASRIGTLGPTPHPAGELGVFA